MLVVRGCPQYSMMLRPSLLDRNNAAVNESQKYPTYFWTHCSIKEPAVAGRNVQWRGGFIGCSVHVSQKYSIHVRHLVDLGVLAVAAVGRVVEHRHEPLPRLLRNPMVIAVQSDRRGLPFER